MRICVAQTRSIAGDIPANLANHQSLVGRAVSHQADIIIFPELSLTGYEPQLAKELATTPDDSRFDNFQAIADTQQIAIGVGVPTHHTADICISTIIFHPHQPRQLYSKHYIHPDEEAFFVPGHNTTTMLGNLDIALAICYEISIPEHSKNAHQNLAKAYVASVAKCVNGIENACQTLSLIARNYSMPVLMSNCVGMADSCECAGKTSVWNEQGLLVGQLDDSSEGMLVFDTDTTELVATVI